MLAAFASLLNYLARGARRQQSLSHTYLIIINIDKCQSVIIIIAAHLNRDGSYLGTGGRLGGAWRGQGMRAGSHCSYR